MEKVYGGGRVAHTQGVRRLLLPLLLVPIVSLTLAAFRPQILTAGFMSWRAFAVTAGVGVAGLLALAVLWRRSRLVAIWTADLVVLALLAAVVWPVFRERTVVESFPPVATVLTSPSPGASPVASATVVPAVQIGAGQLHGIDHRATGRVALYSVGSEVRLRFESVDIEGTPTPSVHLVSPGQRSPKGGVRFGGLKGEKGSFSYAAPAGFDPTRSWTVLVWCDRYAVPIAGADLV